VVDDVVQVTNDQAFEWARRAAREEGVFCGISSGAALYAAGEVARRPENKGKVIVAILGQRGRAVLVHAAVSGHLTGPQARGAAPGRRFGSSPEPE